MSDVSLELDEASISEIIGIEGGSQEEDLKQRKQQGGKGGRQAVSLFHPPLESDKESEEEAFETPERDLRRFEEQKISETKRKPGRPRKDNKVTTSIRRHLLFEKAEDKRKKEAKMGGGKDKERKIEKVKEKLEGAKNQEELMKMLIEEVSKNRVEREDFQERMERRDKSGRR